MGKLNDKFFIIRARPRVGKFDPQCRTAPAVPTVIAQGR